MSLLILQHLVGYLSDSVQFKIAEAAQAAREAARQGRSKRFCPGTPHSIVVRTTYIRPDISFFSLKKQLLRSRWLWRIQELPKTQTQGKENAVIGRRGLGGGGADE
jgi:hypothetical protein